MKAELWRKNHFFKNANCYNKHEFSYVIHQGKLGEAMHTSSDLHADPKKINWVNDPHLKGKIVFDSPLAPFRKWLIILLILVVLGGITWYFSPHIAAIVHNNATTPTKTALMAPAPRAVTDLVPDNKPIMPTIQENSGLGIPAVIEAPNSPQVAENDTERQATANKLLEQAETQLTRLRLTSPEGDNAYETYQALLPIAPDQAQTVLDKIIDSYILKGNEYLKENKFTTPTDKNAYSIYQKVVEIDPHNERSKTLLNIMLDALYKRAETQQNQKHFTEPAGDNLYETYQELAQINPNEPKTQALAEQIVKPLLEQAERQMQQQKYTTPEEDNALDSYQEVLALFPKNEEALAGLNQIVEEYYTLAVRSQKRGSKDSTLELIEKGLSIDADNEKLLDLKVTVSQK